MDIENNKFTFDNHDISIIFDGDKKPWFHANTIAEILGYVRPRKAVNDHVDEKYKTTYSDIKEFDTSKSPIKVLPSSVYIDDTGVCCLLGASKNMKNDFKDWMFKELLPNLRKHQYGVTRLKTENKVFRRIITNSQIQQMFGVLESIDNKKTDHKKIYKLVDTQKRYFNKAVEDSDEYNLCFETEYIITDDEDMTKKVLREMGKKDVKYDYNRKNKYITIYDDDFDIISLVKKLAQEEVLW